MTKVLGTPFIYPQPATRPVKTAHFQGIVQVVEPDKEFSGSIDLENASNLQGLLPGPLSQGNLNLPIAAVFDQTRGNLRQLDQLIQVLGLGAETSPLMDATKEAVIFTIFPPSFGSALLQKMPYNPTNQQVTMIMETPFAGGGCGFPENPWYLAVVPLETVKEEPILKFIPPETDETF